MSVLNIVKGPRLEVNIFVIGPYTSQIPRLIGKVSFTSVSLANAHKWMSVL